MKKKQDQSIEILAEKFQIIQVVDPLSHSNLIEHFMAFIRGEHHELVVQLRAMFICI